MVRIENSKFIKSSSHLSECPSDHKPEFAFVGRSNVGKSSLINLLTGRRSLAKTSATPGKTQLINHFLINDRWYLVDLPGYGYAKSSKKERKKFGILIEDYIRNRKSLLSLFVLIDANIPPQKLDLEFTGWLGENGVPFSLVYTKTDKPNKRNLEFNLKRFRQEMHKTWEKLPPEFISSSKKRTGKEEILKYIYAFV